MDKKINQIINEIAEEEGISKAKVEASIRNMTDWTRRQLIEMNYVSILWSYFGSFSLIEKRCDDEQKEIIKEFKETFKKSKDEETN